MGKRILLVDDEPLMLKGLKYTLEQEGYETDLAMDGEEAMEKFQQQNFGTRAEAQGNAADPDAAANGQIHASQAVQPAHGQMFQFQPRPRSPS